MSIMSSAEARKDLDAVMDEACASRAPVVITRDNAQSVVMMSLEEYESLQETLHLLRSPRNAERLMRSIADADAGRFVDPGIDP